MRPELYMRSTTLQITREKRHNPRLHRTVGEYTAWVGTFCIILVLAQTGCQYQTVGDRCNENEFCERGLFCAQGVTGGYCTAICNQALPCPARTLCVSIEGVDQNNNRVVLQRCLQPCFLPEDCRSGLSCLALNVGQQKVCFPPSS